MSRIGRFLSRIWGGSASGNNNLDVVEDTAAPERILQPITDLRDSAAGIEKVFSAGALTEKRSDLDPLHIRHPTHQPAEFQAPVCCPANSCHTGFNFSTDPGEDFPRFKRDSRFRDRAPRPQEGSNGSVDPTP